MNDPPAKSAGRSERRVRSLRDLPRHMPPGRDLWPQIEARLPEPGPAQTRSSKEPLDRASEAGPAALPPTQRRDAQAAVFAGWRLRLAAALGLLALGAALTIGIRTAHGPAGYPDSKAAVAGQRSAQAEAVDPRARAALLRSLDARLQGLPAPSRQKVLADFNVIEHSMQDIQNALGRDPGNELLREMLLETYQDEQQLIATVQEAGLWTEEADSGKGSI